MFRAIAAGVVIIVWFILEKIIAATYSANVSYVATNQVNDSTTALVATRALSTGDYATWIVSAIAILILVAIVWKPIANLIKVQG